MTGSKHQASTTSAGDHPPIFTHGTSVTTESSGTSSVARLPELVTRPSLSFPLILILQYFGVAVLGFQPVVV